MRPTLIRNALWDAQVVITSTVRIRSPVTQMVLGNQEIQIAEVRLLPHNVLENESLRQSDEETDVCVD